MRHRVFSFCRTPSPEIVEFYSWILGFISASTAHTDDAFYGTNNSLGNRSLIDGMLDGYRDNAAATRGRTTPEFVTQLSG